MNQCREFFKKDVLTDIAGRITGGWKRQGSGLSPDPTGTFDFSRDRPWGGRVYAG